MDGIKKILKEMNQKLDSFSQKLDSHSAALIRIKSVLEGYADAYKVNKGNIIRHEKRISKIEDNLDIQAPPGLIVVG